MTEALGTYLGSRDRGETTSGPKLTSVPTLSSLRRPGSPPPELLTCEGTRTAGFCKWHFGALTVPQKCQWHGFGNTSFLSKMAFYPNVSIIAEKEDESATPHPSAVPGIEPRRKYREEATSRFSKNKSSVFTVLTCGVPRCSLQKCLLQKRNQSFTC
jgi:hypothetical protein